MRLFRDRINVKNIINKVNKKDLIMRHTLLVIGTFIAALAFNLFFLKYGIVCFGISGLSIILNEYGINPVMFIAGASIFLLLLSFALLGFEKTKNSIIGSILFPLFVSITEVIVPYIQLDKTEMIVIAVFGGVLSGIGYGLIFKAGFTTGGTDILNQIVAKYFKISIGSAMIIVDGLIVISAKIVFPWEIVLYGIISLYIISIMSDKVILGISESKAFYIITEEEDQVKAFLLSLLNSGVTILSARGGYSGAKQSVLMCVISTKQYFIVKEGIAEIDPEAFFVVTDAYEVSNRG